MFRNVTRILIRVAVLTAVAALIREVAFRANSRSLHDWPESAE